MSGTVVAMSAEGPTEAIPSPASETAAILHMIERAARDPAIDLDKLERLVAMRREVEDRAAEREWKAGMHSAQSDMRPIAADAANSQTHSKYATYAQLDRALRPIYTKYGLSVTFDTDISPKGNEYVRVLGFVEHSGGHTRAYKIDIPIITKGPKGNDVMTPIHATQSAFTYGKRGLLGGMFNIAVGETDDDGNAAAGSQSEPKITKEQVFELDTLIEDIGVDKPKFLQFIKVEKLEDIVASKFQAAKNLIESKRKK